MSDLNQIFFAIGNTIPIITIYRYLVSNRFNLDNRISAFIDTGQAAVRLSKFKTKFKLRQKVNTGTNLQELLASAEFGDLLAVALVSGQNPRASIEVISEYLSSNFKEGIRSAIRENAFGKPLMMALKEMTEKKETRSLKPLIRQMENAIYRGTPLAEVSRIFAEEQRLKFRNQLMKQAAAREISMLVPVVFVVLPSVLAVALYPALTVLQKLG